MKEAKKMNILDKIDKVTDEQFRDYIEGHLEQVDRATLICIACCIDVYQRKQAGTLADCIPNGVRQFGE